jgi:hypothetical protein
MYKLKFLSLLFLFSITFLGCNVTRHVPEGDYLYLGESITIDASGNIPNKGRLMEELEDVTGPEPNFSIFGMKPKLYFYNFFGGPDAKGLWKWLQDRIGEPPILLTVVKPDRVQDLMINRLFNNGHFNPEVEYNIETRNRKAEIEYIAHINPPFTINEIYFPDGETEIEARIRETKENTLLQENAPYNLSLLTEERDRMDSTIGDRELNIYLSLKPDLAPQVTKVYRINDIFINTNHIQGRNFNIYDTLLINGYHFVSSFGQYRPKPILRSVFLHKDSIYSREEHVFTLSRLMGLGALMLILILLLSGENLYGQKSRGFLNPIILLGLH